MRILVLLAIGLLLYLSFRHLWRRAQAERRANKRVNEQQMVRCDFCGLHLLPQEARQKDGHYFCSEEHLTAFHNKADG
ncbi:hypothetical protein Q7C_435 [Methylophaga frappieri]|uniref:TRASH domain-containing protein n=1 Tax=Methylophaga frappieri (strain ATCC BAA-2434 / DSM 25690 / JAM7) TaxID=754477 RepID=I1YFB7_METFJ|nr:PP0621 family protein [Methylophaga frappieri]AFJ01610.1 hypothetical protein Q7C_435 [Methylophaga frappieri]